MTETGIPAPTSGRPAELSKPEINKEGLFQEWLPDQWSVAYVALLVYTFAMVTGRLPVGTVAVAIGMTSVMFSGPGFRLSKPLYWMIAMLAWGAVGWIFSDFPELVSDKLFDFTKLVLVALLTISTVRTPKQARFFIIFAFLCFLAYPVRGALTNYFVLNYTNFGRAIAGGMYVNANDLAAVALLQLSVAISIYVSARHRTVKLASLVVATLMAITILLTQSRAGYLGTLSFLALVIVTGRKRIQAFMAVLIALVVIASLVPASTFERFSRLTSALIGETSIREADPEGSAAGRSDIYRIAWEISKDNLVFGVGMGAYEINNELYARNMDNISASANKRIDAHSTYLNLLAETGAIGLLLFLLMVRTALKKVKHTRLELAYSDPLFAEQLRILAAGYMGFMIAAVVGTFNPMAITYVHLFAIWVLADNTLQQKAESKSDSNTTAQSSVV